MKKKIGIVLLAIAMGCLSDPTLDGVEFRTEMRNFVGELSFYAKQTNPDFVIIPQNGIELVTLNGEENGPAAEMYLSNIDAVGQEDLFYGYNSDNKKSPEKESNYLLSFLKTAQNSGKPVLVTDYCTDPSKMDDSFGLNNSFQFISYAAPDRELRVIPSYPPAPRNSNDRDITAIEQADNFLYLINPESYSTKAAFISAIVDTNFDVVLIDAFFNEEIWLASEVEAMKVKKNGGQRMVISYMSIGEAEDYRFYWKDEYYSSPPDWLHDENKNWPGNYKVRYWLDSWKDIIFGSNDAYLDKLINAGFDGAYLDIIEGYEYFESL